MQKNYIFKTLPAAFVLAFFSLHASAQIVINEGSNRNYAAIADEDGDHPDWIELYNAGTDTVDLADYTITDKSAQPTQWTFPHVSMLPGEYKTVFCSGKDRAPVSGFVNVVTSANFNATVGWNTHTFTTPFYWDGLSNIIINTCSYSSTGYTTNSVMNQTTTSFASSVFSYQDGSPAACASSFGTVSNDRPNMRLNGYTIGTGTVQNCNTCYPAPYGNWYWGARNQMIILASELTAAGLTAGNITSLAFDVVATDPATVYDYIEVNMRLVSVPAVTATFMPVDPNNYLHTNFKLSSNGDTVFLYNSVTQNLESSLYVNDLALDVSSGRFPDASSNLVLFQTPTPTATNNNSATYTAYELTPAFSVASGLYQTAINVSITNLNPPSDSSSVYYTTDGSDPTTASTLYTGTPIPIFYSSVLKARVFSDVKIASPTAVATYFFGINHVTPIISVVTDPANLYGSTGIFDNYEQDWIRAAYVEYFDTLNTLIVSQNAGIRMDGGAGGSRSNPQRSFRIEFDNSVIGDGSVQYPLIPDRPNRTKYSDIYLRNGSNQYLILPYKDAAAVRSMCGETNAYYSAYRPVTVYVNGGYFGLYELREKFDTEYFKTLEGADPDSVDLFSVSYWYGGGLRALEGSIDSFYVAYNAFTALNPADTGYWDAADKYFDMTYYTDYIISESWMTNTDWPYNNIKIYRSNASDFRYRFCTIDLEPGFEPNAFQDCYFDHIDFMLNQDPNIPYINIFLQSLQNNRFHDYFINRFADVMNTAYLYNRISAIETGLFNWTVVEMQNEYSRWGDPNQVPQQMNDFYNNHLLFNSQIAARTTVERDDIQNNFNLPNQVDLTLDVFPAGAGTIHISTIQPTTYPWQGVYFNGVPVKIEAIANPGYHFLQWGNNGIISDTLNAVFNDTLQTFMTNFTAYFATNPIGIANVTEQYEGWSLFPNPATNNLFLTNTSSESAAGAVFQILDLTGRVVMEEPVSSSATKTMIDITSLPAAVYLLRVQESGGTVRQFRFVKVRG